MSILSEHLFGCFDGSKGNLLQHDDVSAQFVAGRGMFLEEMNDPFSACLMEMDLSSSITEDFMVEEYARVPSPSVSTFITNTTTTTTTTIASPSQYDEEQEYYKSVNITTSQMDPWNQIPAYFQEQLFLHYGLYLKEVQQVLDLQLQMDNVLSDTSSPPSSVTSSPISSTPASPAVAQVPKMEKRKKSMPSFKVDHYKLHNKRQKREDSEPLSPTTLIEDNSDNSNSSFSYPIYTSEPNTPIPSSLNNSSNISNISNISTISSPSPTPRTLITVAEELASAFLPSVSQIEEEIRAGTSSASAATTVIELTKRPELLTLKQSEAARIMGISTSVLSKRWREATRGKKWPHRIHHKLKRAAIC